MTKKISLSIAFLLLGFVSVFAQVARVWGTVADSTTTQKLSAVNVQLVGGKTYSTVTSLQGTFAFSAIPHGSYTLVLSSVGYNGYSKSITVSADMDLSILLSEQVIPLGEVVVSSLRVNQKLKEVAAPMAIVGRTQIDASSAVTISNVLQNEPGLSLSGDGVWSTSVNVRGMGEQRLVTLVDGNRVETATDLTAGLSMVDPDDVERIEVVKGATSSLYGTGAMGGIVNVITRDGYFGSKFYFGGGVNSGYSKVNELFTRKLTLNSGAERWYARVSGSMYDASNLKTPSGTLPNSQFEGGNLSASVGAKPFANQVVKLSFQQYSANDVGIPGGAVFPGPAEATYTNIDRRLFSASYEFQNLSEALTSLSVKYFNQYILRDVELKPNTVTTTPTQIVTPQLFTPTGEHNTHSVQVQSNWNFANGHNLIAGIDAWQRKLTTQREKYIKVDILNTNGDIVKTNNMVRGETPNPESTFGSAGLFVQDEFRLMDNRLKLTIGGRFDAIRVENARAYDIDYLIVNGVRNDTPPNQRITFEEGAVNDFSWSANVGAIYSLTSDMDLSLSAGRSFRAPSLEERFKYIDLGNFVRLGDPELNPEKGYALDLGFRVWKPRFSFTVNLFSNWISDMIVEAPGEFIYTLNTGANAGTTDTIAAFINANVSKALLYGFDLGFQYNVYHNLVLFGAGAYVRGEDTENDTNLPLIPPMNGRIGVRYTLPKYFGVELVAVGAANQTKVATGEKETSGYARYDFTVRSSSINLKFAKAQLFGGIENIGDRAYRNHLATNRGAISQEAGRNIFVKVKIDF